MNKNDPLISVVTVVYNGLALIEETILSVLNQSYPLIEYIIIDGGSNDGTLNIIKKYEDRISFWLSEPDKGIYDAMNKGVKNCKGEWINFMNAGDSFHNEDVLKNVFSSYDGRAGVIYGPVNCFDRYKRVVVKPMSLEKLDNRMAFCHQSSFVKRDLLLQFKFDLAFKISADYHLFYQLYKSGVIFFETSFCIANYEIETGLSSKNLYLSEKNNLKINNRWGKPLAMTNFYFKCVVFYSMFTLKRLAPNRVMKILNQIKYG